MKIPIICFVVGVGCGAALMVLATLHNNRICFKDGECKTFYTAQQMKDWLYSNTP